MLRFEKYYQPKTIDECVELLKEYGKDAVLLAGGTDVVPHLKLRPIYPKAVIGMMDIPGMDQIVLTDEGLELGACANLREISLDTKLDADYPVVKEAAGHVSSQQVRNMATIGGNACNASPSADAIHGPLLNDAVVEIAGPAGRRQMPFCDFFKGPGKTALEEGEMLVRFFLPKPAPHTGCSYKKFAIRGDSDISIVGAGARITLDDSGVIADARITLAAVAPVPLRCRKAEAMLTGQKPSAELFAAAAKECAENEATPIADQRATKEYRVRMVEVWAKHALEEAAERAAKN